MALSRIRAQHIGTSVAMEEISMEEEALLIQESAGDLAEAEAEIEDAQELADTSDALEDLAMVADGIDEASENEVALVEAGVQLATAGSDLEVEDVAPGLESYIGRRISTEGIKEISRNIYEAIVRAIKKFWEKIKAFFRKTVGTLANLKRSAEALRKRADQTQGKTVKEKQTDLGSEANALSVGFKAPKTGDQVVSAVSHIGESMKSSMGGFNTEVKNICEAVGNALDDLDGETVAEIEPKLAAVVTAAKPMKVQSTLRQMSKRSLDKRYPASMGDVFCDDEIPGNKALVLVVPNTGAGGSVIKQAQRLRGVKVQLVSCTDQDKDPITKATITTMSPAQCEKLSEHIIDFVSEIASYENGKGRKDADKAKERLEKSLSKVKSRVDKLKADEGAVLSNYRAGINIVPTLLHLCGGPQAQLTAQFLSTARAAIVAGNKSLSQYH